jgi:hypothetical protein
MATEEIQFLDDELQSIYAEVRKGIEQLASMQVTADKKLEKYSQLTSRVSRARTVFQSFKVELRELRDEEKKAWQAVSAFLLEQLPFFARHQCILLKRDSQKEKEHNQTITKLDSDLKMAKSNWERKDLMDGKESSFSSPFFAVPPCILHVFLTRILLLTVLSNCHRTSRIQS